MHTSRTIIDFYDSVFSDFSDNIYRNGIEEYAQGQLKVEYPAVIIDSLEQNFTNNYDNIQKTRQISVLILDNIPTTNDFEAREQAIENTELIMDKAIAKFYETYRENNIAIMDLNEISAVPYEDVQKGDYGFLMTTFVMHSLNLEK